MDEDARCLRVVKLDLPLQGRADSMYVSALKEERFWSCDRFLLAVKTDMPEQPTATQVPGWTHDTALSSGP